MRRLLFILFALPCTALGWGCDGHQIVALIARAHLTPAASAAVDRILTADPIPLVHDKNCQDTPADLMAVAAPWADNVKSSNKTFLWHQIDIPNAVTSGDYHKWCDPIGPSINGKDRPGCIVNALEYEIAVMRDPAKSASDRGVALRMVIHLMGDLSQPEHVSDNYDEGGNCTTFTLPYLDHPTNLHAMWDYEFINHELRTQKLSEEELTAKLNDEFADQGKQWLKEKTDVVGWTWEAHKLGINLVYGLLNPSMPVASANAGLVPSKAVCDELREKVASMNIPINQNYQDLALKTIHTQLAKAGYRLAEVLNDTLK